MKRKLKKWQIGGEPDPTNPFGQAPWLAKGQPNPLMPNRPSVPIGYAMGNCPAGFIFDTKQGKCIKLPQEQKPVDSTPSNSALNPAPPNEADPQFQIKSQPTFGNINYGYRALSNSIQGIAAFFREKHNRAGQNAYYQAQFNPLNFIQETGNTSEQNQFGMDYALKGGMIPKSTKIKGKKISAKQRKFFSDLCKLEEGGFIEFAKGGPTDPSIVNFLESQGRKSDKDSRRALAAQYGVEGYDFSAEKNLELLNVLRGQKSTDTKYAADAGKTRFKIGVNNAPVLPGQKEWMPKTAATSAITPTSIAPKGFPNHPSKYAKPTPKQEVLESGVIVDKRTGRGFVVKNGKIEKEFPTITGSNVNSNSNSISFPTSADLDKLPKSGRATPVGYYGMRNIRHKEYGNDIMMLDPMAAFDKPRPDAAQIAIHKTYDRKNRDKLYETATPWGSYGCVNCKDDDIRAIKKQFPKGDTLRVMDSKRPEDLAYLNRLIKGKQYAKGGEVDMDEEFENEIFGEPVVNNTQVEEVVEQQETPETPMEADWIDEYLMGSRQQTVKPDMATGEPEEVLEAFKNGISNVESGGDYYAQAKGSSAYGKYQFTKGTLEQVRKQFFPNVKPKEFETAYKTDPDFQEKVMDVYGTYLLSTSNTPQEAALKHFLGEVGAKKATSPTYHPGGINLNVGAYVNKFNKGFKYEQGGTYEVPDDEIENLRNQGYDIEIL